MFKEFVIALVQKIVVFLSAETDFFQKSVSQKKEALKDLSIPKAFQDYLSEVDEKTFLSDLELMVRFVHQPKDKAIAKSPFFKAFLEFLTTDLARKIDLLDSKYFLLQKSEREEIIGNLIKGDSLLAITLRDILLNFSYQQIAESINNIGNIVANTPYIVVQSPREIKPELKREIREELYKENPLSFPTFQTNKKLIGGIRIFKNGTTQDNSWLSRVLRFTSLTTA